jgi:hypothetical protein
MTVAILRIARVALFIAAIVSPLIAFVVRQEAPHRIDSKSELSVRPTWGWYPSQWGNFALAYRAYFNDHFGFREDLIQTHAFVSFNYLGVAANRKVLVGKQGWLYLGDYESAIECARRIRPFTHGELEAWRNSLERIRNHLRQRGIRYVFVVTPNKDTIYPEFLPNWVNQVHSRSRLDQLITHMYEHSDVTVVDLRPALFAAKKEFPLYFKTDSHWNALGACVASEVLNRTIRGWYPEAQPYTVFDFSIKTNPQVFKGDLLDLGGVGGWVREDEIVVIPHHHRRAKPEKLLWGEIGSTGFAPLFATTTESPKFPSTVIFRDSFFGALQPFVSEYFRRAVFVWRSFDPSVVEKESCEIVIHQMVERHLMQPAPVTFFLDGSGADKEQ